MNMNRLYLHKKRYEIILIILLVIATPIYLVGWLGHFLGFLGADVVYGLRWMFVFGYFFVPPFFIASSILAGILALIETNKAKKVFYLILTAATFTLGMFTLLTI